MGRSEQEPFPSPRKPLEGRELYDHFIELAEIIEKRGLRSAIIAGVVPPLTDEELGLHGPLVSETLRYAAKRVIVPPSCGMA